jgi:MFS family permease
VAHDEMKNPNSEPLELGERAWPLFSVSLVVGVVALVVAVALGWRQQDSFRHFYFAYLTSWGYFLSIVLGAILFVLCQHLTSAGWSVNVRRVAELIGATMPILAALAAPIVVSILLYNGSLYSWAQPLPPVIEKSIISLPADAGLTSHQQQQQKAEKLKLEAQEQAEGPALGHDRTQESIEHLAELSPSKRIYLGRTFFIVRLVIYLLIWSGTGIWYWRKSVRQDETGDVALSRKMHIQAGWLTLLIVLTLTLGAWDIFMSLDPTWYSTMFGIYYFAGAAVAIFATLTVVTALLQRGGLLKAVNKEHYHDLGTFMFAFVFFWGYIAYSQYMLYWYASVPEELGWLHRRGTTTVPGDINGWTWVSVVMLFGMFILPFAGLLSRHVKRTRWSIVFWAVVLLVAHWIEMWWIVMPEYNGKVVFGLIEITTFLGIGGILIAAATRLASRHALRPIRDPRVAESMAFENI